MVMLIPFAIRAVRGSIRLIAAVCVLLPVAAAAQSPTTQPGTRPARPPTRRPPSAGLTPPRAALLLVENEQYEEARRIIEPYVREHPADGRAELILALSYHKENRYEEARPHFEQALKTAPDYHPTLYYYGYCLYYLGESEGAREAFETFLKHRPDYGDAHFGLGLLELDANRLDEAEKRFKTAIRLSAKSRQPPGRETASAHARLADVYMAREEWEQARGELETAVAIDRDLYGAHFKLYRVLVRLGEMEAARKAKAEHDAAVRRAGAHRGFPEQ